MKKKILSFLIAFCLVVPCAFTLVACKDKAPKMEVWDGSIAEVSQAVNNVIIIDTAEELAGFAKSVNSGNDYAGKTVKLACDMDMANKTWTPIGVGNRKKLTAGTTYKFSGTFDGNGKRIFNLSNEGYVPSEVNKTSESDLGNEGKTYSYGFFGITKNATIKNLTLEVDFDCDDENLKGDSVGGLVGFANEGLTIINCTVKGEIDGGYDAVAGLVGRAYNSTSEKSVIIENCVNNAEVEAMFKAAGIIGYANSDNLYLKIDNCVNNGNIEVNGMERDGTICSVVSGILNYGWTSLEINNTIIVTNNKNTGILESVEELIAGKENKHAYTYIACSIANEYREGYSIYNFEGNSNTGLVKYLDEIATDTLGATIRQLYTEYQTSQDYNLRSNIR